MIQLIVGGLTNEKIADVPSISITTVETHRASAMRKLQIDTTATLTRYAIKNKMVET